jgi:hypothetical protein
MKELLPRYVIGFLVGIGLGRLFPDLMPAYATIPILMMTVVIVEIIGNSGFGNKWKNFRVTGHAFYSAT